jgi:hypothetical protein
MLRYISIIDIIVLGGLIFAWAAPLKVLNLKGRKGERLSEEKMAQWLPRVRPIVIGLFFFLIIGRLAMYHFSPSFIKMNESFWGLEPLPASPPPIPAK